MRTGQSCEATSRSVLGAREPTAGRGQPLPPPPSNTVMRLAAFTTPPVPAPADQPVVRVLMDDGISYLTHEMEGAPGDGRLPQLSFTTSMERAKLFQVTDWNESERTFGLRCDLGYLTNADSEVRAGVPKKGKQETWTAVSNGEMSNQEQYLAGYVEVWSASMRNDPLTGVHKNERGWRVHGGVAGRDKLAVDVPNRDSELSNLSQFKFEPVDQSSVPAKELSIWRVGSDRKRPLGYTTNSLMEVSQRNQKKMCKSGVKPGKLNKPKTVKGASNILPSA